MVHSNQTTIEKLKAAHGKYKTIDPSSDKQKNYSELLETSEIIEFVILYLHDQYHHRIDTAFGNEVGPKLEDGNDERFDPDLRPKFPPALVESLV